MKIAHISDLHSRLIPLPNNVDLIVSTGDFLPNAKKLVDQRSSREEYIREDIKYQRNWIYHHKKQLKNWLGDRKLFWTSGNHERTSYEEDFKAIGLDITYLDDIVLEFNGLLWAGFPYVVRFQDNWNFEKTSEELSQEQQRLKRKIKDCGKPLDILCAHAPPYGILDFYQESLKVEGENLGSQPLADWISYGEDKPKYIFCGHVHSAHGYQEANGVHVYNSATIYQTIEIS